MTLNTLFDSLGKFCADPRLPEACKPRDDLARQVQNMVGERFARMEEKSSTAQSENSVLKERLFLRLLFTFLGEIGPSRDCLREVHRVVEMNLFSFAKTRFKCLNSAVGHVDCGLTSPAPAHRVLSPRQRLPPPRDLPQRGRGLPHLRGQEVRRAPDQAVLLQRLHAGQRRGAAAVRLHDRELSRSSTSSRAWCPGSAWPRRSWPSPSTSSPPSPSSSPSTSRTPCSTVS